MAVSLRLLAVDYQTLRVDPDARNRKDDMGFQNQRERDSMTRYLAASFFPPLFA